MQYDSSLSTCCEKSSELNATEPYCWKVSIGSGNGLVPSGNRPLSEPMLIQIYITIWCHKPQWIDVNLRCFLCLVPILKWKCQFNKNCHFDNCFSTLIQKHHFDEHFPPWFPWKLSKWQLPVPPVMEISSKWQHSCLSVYAISKLHVRLVGEIRCLYCDSCDNTVMEILCCRHVGACSWNWGILGHLDQYTTLLPAIV